MTTTTAAGSDARAGNIAQGSSSVRGRPKSRRTRVVALIAGVAFASTATVAAPATAQPVDEPMTSSAALPAVNMAAVVVASQVEPRVGGNRSALGDDSSTRVVQRALTARGFNTASDGWFGAQSRDQYAAYQRSLGYTGVAANGIPGPASLTRLGSNRFTINHKVEVGSTRDSYGGKRVNTRTKRMLTAADRTIPRSLRITKGSYNGCDRISKCTHAGGGVVDISVTGLTSTQRWKTVEALRSVGFAAWLRTPPSFSYHIHAIAIGDTDLHRQSADQVGDYYAKKNGLADRGPDNTPPAYRSTFTWWEK